jgi:hypothetical protein
LGRRAALARRCLTEHFARMLGSRRPAGCNLARSFARALRARGRGRSRCDSGVSTGSRRTRPANRTNSARCPAWLARSRAQNLKFTPVETPVTWQPPHVVGPALL